MGGPRLGSPAFFPQTPRKRRGDEPRVEIDPLAHRAAPRCGAEGLAFIVGVGSGFLVLRHLRSECFLSVYDCVCMCHQVFRLSLHNRSRPSKILDLHRRKVYGLSSRSHGFSDRISVAGGGLRISCLDFRTGSEHGICHPRFLHVCFHAMDVPRK